MDEAQQAHHELERLQGIITRHESHMFVLRGWLLAIVGGLLAAYYTNNIDMSARIENRSIDNRFAVPGC